ncbi:MAG: hypothetical protein WC792_01365 [Candidatus Micrarchaeia archaeon]|jgi:hypothetical protein
MADKVSPQAIDELKMEIHTLDSKISLIAQKIKMIEKNEEVIGRTIVLHNDKLRKLEEGGAGASAGAGGADLGDLKKSVSDLQALVEKCATKDELRELKYVLDTINPLDYATISQVKELLDERLGSRK